MSTEFRCRAQIEPINIQLSFKVSKARKFNETKSSWFSERFRFNDESFNT